jgi:hypothetical protein
MNIAICGCGDGGGGTKCRCDFNACSKVCIPLRYWPLFATCCVLSSSHCLLLASYYLLLTI